MNDRMSKNALVVQEIGQKVAMHAVAMKPRYLSPETVPAEALEGEAAHVTGTTWGVMHARSFLLHPSLLLLALGELTPDAAGGGHHSMMHARILHVAPLL